MERKFFDFYSNDKIAEHISQVKTLGDLNQLINDIKASGTNHIRIKFGVPGAWAIDAMANSPTQRHVFMSRQVYEQNPQYKADNDIASLTIFLED